MNAFTLACLLGSVASVSITTDLATDPCPSRCGPDVCKDLHNPCDDLVDFTNPMSADNDWKAYEQCYKTTTDPRSQCYTVGEYADCLKDETEEMLACRARTSGVEI